MKSSLVAGLTATRRYDVDLGRTIGFMGDEARVYNTPALIYDMEVTCRDLLLKHADAGEDSVGTRVEVDHMAPTLLGQWVEITVTVDEVKGPGVTFSFTAKDSLDKIGKGVHKRFIVDVDQTKARLLAKAEKAKAAQ
ncbi:LysR family transcriptional regulator [Paramagnetospirillum kuznetsovii]|uniref:LysR family transcriptional regulator n=1 Tax=Paramagnetospirillum kuznetsovii TaxID=2053833 RepID=A0A364NV59_9PROT|nr:LysR family transcriptional regulator [Paramagnetospirillum kuznetsovii]RAU20969.1 LysR family transcriptional regulator [Paramagnetospirillum kuznetsovii]